nr:Ltp family lipoprotein [Clostridioides sp.]
MNLKKKEANETINTEGTEKKDSIFKRVIKNRIFIAILFFFLGGSILGSKSTDVEKENEPTKTQVETKKSVDTSPADNSIDTAKQEVTNTNEESAKTESAVPVEFTSALKKAEIYSDTMHMSKAGLYDQLISEYGEKFSVEAAQYAIDNINTDWNKNALEKAKIYQNDMAMSPSSIEDQLKSEHGEKFTSEEASYAVQHLND